MDFIQFKAFASNNQSIHLHYKSNDFYMMWILALKLGFNSQEKHFWRLLSNPCLSWIIIMSWRFQISFSKNLFLTCACFYEQNRCLSKMLENQKSTLYHKEQKILEHNQLILKHKEAMEQTVASMEQEKTREVS